MLTTCTDSLIIAYAYLFFVIRETHVDPMKPYTPQSLKQSWQMFDRFNFLTENIVHVHDFTTKELLFVNTRISDALGYDSAEISHINNLLALVHEVDLPLLKLAFSQLTTDADEPVNYTFRARHKNGEWRQLHSRISILSYTADHTPYEIIGITKDITPRLVTEANCTNSSYSLPKPKAWPG